MADLVPLPETRKFRGRYHVPFKPPPIRWRWARLKPRSHVNIAYRL